MIFCILLPMLYSPYNLFNGGGLNHLVPHFLLFYRASKNALALLIGWLLAPPIVTET